MGTEMFSLEGKTALVTGASRGIGAAIAIAYAECGADVAVAARSTADLEEVSGKIEATGRRALPLTCDVTDSAQVTETVRRTIAELGQIDVLVNNAGGSRFMSPLVETREDGWHKGIALNLDSVFYFCKAVGAHMLERKKGSVINTASVAGISAAPTLSFYAAAKGAVANLAKTLAVEWGWAGVRCNTISPGWVKTALNHNLWGDPKTEKATIAGVPLARWGDTSDITGAAVWLASDASRYVTGANIVIDGGQTA